MISFREYIGIPFKYGGRDKSGVDCWGIITLIYKEKRNIDIFDMTNYDASVESASKFYKSISGFHKLWKEINIDTKILQPYDVILFTLDLEQKDIPTHIALYTDLNKIIHCTENMPVTITRMNRWLPFAHSAYRYIGENG
jgi:cell wall-associated NlpC family hydrolase